MLTVESWLAAALADADRRALSELRPLLEALARSTEALRKLDEDLRRADMPPPPREG